MKITDSIRLQYYDPFGGDETRVECQKVKIVTVKKRHICFASYNPDNNPKEHFIEPGQRARFETSLIEDGWHTSWHCLKCIDKELRRWH